MRPIAARRIAALLLLLLVAFTAMAIGVGDTVGISVREAELRSGTGFLSRILSKLQYLDEVTILSDPENGWLEVEVVSTGERGWIHASGVAEPEELQIGTGGTAGGATNREIALAGRGFNEQVEEQIKADEDLDFSVVDEMESFILETEEAVQFLVVAGLEQETGGDQ
jgi:hypothetical protein